MSRTNRNTKYANLNARKIKHKPNLSTEQKALMEIKEAGHNVSNRLANFKSRIPTNWDDKPVSGNSENFSL